MLTDLNSKTIGLILAGNIPLVGFHDVLSVFISGHRSQIKLSDKDKFLLPFLTNQLLRINPEYSSCFEYVNRLKDYDAIIATGSNTTGNYFEKYFRNVPHIIRKNRHGVAVICNDVKDEELVELGSDIFAYYGLGCRNVSKLYLENGFEIDRLFKAAATHEEVMKHNKYMNNYDYNNAMYLLNKEDFLTNDFLLLRESTDISSRIATVNYEYFQDTDSLIPELRNKQQEIQCVVSHNLSMI